MDRAALDVSGPIAEADRPKPSRLDRIADLLGCPVETFTDGAPPDDPAVEAGELLRLWLAISDKSDRAKVLSLARKLAQA